MDERADQLNQNGTDAGGLDAGATVEEIRADIENTRAEMSETIEAIQEKLSPQHIRDEVKEKLHDATLGRVQHAAENAREKIETVGEHLESVVAPVARDAGEKVGAAGATLKEKGRGLLGTIKRNPLPAVLFVAGVSAISWWYSRRPKKEWWM